MRNDSQKSKQPRPRGKSTTSDILGGASGNPVVPSKWAAQHRLLTELREKFTGQKLAGSEGGKGQLPTVSEHMADAATDSYDRDWALAILSSAQNALYEIEEALNRIWDGTYGVCEVTGKPIEAARLKAIPWARFSAAAQEKLEGHGSAGRTQLGEVGTYFSSGENVAADEDVEELKEAA